MAQTISTTPSPEVVSDRLIIKAVFAFVGKAAQRWIGLKQRELTQLERLALLLRGASEEEMREIMEAMAEVIFPQEMVGGVIDPEKEAPADVLAKLDRYRKAVGEAIKNRREALGFTQQELADKAGIPQSHVSRLEVGKHAPTHVTIKKLAKALRTEPAQLDPGFPDED